MEYSSGTRSLLSEVLGWAFVAVVMALGVAHYGELKRMTAEALGLPTPERMATAEAQTSSQSESADETSSGAVEIKAGFGGHYHAEAEVNGRSVQVLVDTGATLVALTYEDAESAGLFVGDRAFTHSVSTANGVARVAPVTIDRISIGNITVRNVEAVVCERGRLTTTLLGMSFLSRLERVDMRSGVLVLQD